MFLTRAAHTCIDERGEISFAGLLSIKGQPVEQAAPT
jgi:hypothetical protein